MGHQGAISQLLKSSVAEDGRWEQVFKSSNRILGNGALISDLCLQVMDSR